MEGSQGGDISGAVEQLRLKEAESKAVVEEVLNTCLEMGYQLTDLNKAVQELKNRGNIEPRLEDIIDTIDVLNSRQQNTDRSESNHNETPLEENSRLKGVIFCWECCKNNVNALFLPCSHHRLCTECAEPLTNCPFCDKHIRQTIKTFMS